MHPRHTQHRLTFAAASFAVALGVATLPFVNASCRSRQARADDPAQVERLRALTHAENGQLPPEKTLSDIETANPDTRTAALARLARARLKLAANDFNGAAALLDSKAFRQHTAIADYALLLRGEALAKANRGTDARAAYEQLARET